MNYKLFELIYQNELLKKENYIEIANSHEKINFTKGTYILKKNDIPNEFFILEKGLFRSFVHDYNGDEITTDFFCENEVVIEVSSLFQRIPTQQYIIAITDVIVWKITFNDFQRLFHSSEGMREWGRNWMSNQLFLSKKRSIEFFTLTATERYLILFKENPQIIKQAALKHIASYLGITDTSLSRIRKEIFIK